MEAGDYRAAKAVIEGTLTLRGVPGRTRIIDDGGGPCLSIAGGSRVTLSGIRFVDGSELPRVEEYALVVAERSALAIENCIFLDSPGSGLRMEECSGNVSGCEFARISATAPTKGPARPDGICSATRRPWTPGKSDI